MVHKWIFFYFFFTNSGSLFVIYLGDNKRTKVFVNLSRYAAGSTSVEMSGLFARVWEMNFLRVRFIWYTLQMANRFPRIAVNCNLLFVFCHLCLNSCVSRLYSSSRDSRDINTHRCVVWNVVATLSLLINYITRFVLPIWKYTVFGWSNV